MSSPVEAALAKSIGSAALKCTGWLAQIGMRKVSDVRTARRLTPYQVEGQDIADLASTLSRDSRRAFINFCSGAEYREIVFKLATKSLLRTHGGNADEYEAATREELRRLIELHVSTSPTIEPLVNSLYEVSVVQVQLALKAVVPDDQTGLSPAARAALVRSATLLAAESSANCQLLRTIDNLDQLSDFEMAIRGAILGMHSAMRLPHAGTSRLVPYERLFVQPRIELTGSSHTSEDISHLDHALKEIEDSGADSGYALSSAIQDYPRVVLLGDPGGGKTTASLKLVHDICAQKVSSIAASVAFWVSLKDYAPLLQDGTSVVQYIELLCRVPYAVDPPEDAVTYLLLNGRAAVFFDGLDELTDTSDRRKIVQAVEGFTNKFPSAPILVTSRRIGYSEAALDSETFTVFELGSFDSDQVESYARKWFSLDDSIELARQATIAESFLHDSRFVRDLTGNPLMLSLMCGIYAGEGYIPRNRPDVYEKCALLLFDKWDKQRGIDSPISFDAHIQSAMRHIAYQEYTSEKSGGIPRREIVESVRNYLLEKRFDNEDDAEQAAVEFVDFCKGRAWVLTEIGVDLFGFTHRTFLEYFTASYLVRKNANAQDLLRELWSHLIRSEWDVVCQLAVQLLGKTVDDGADDFIDLALSRLVAGSPTRTTYENEVGLSFCVRLLSFLVPKPAVLDRLISTCIDSFCDESDTFSAEPKTHAILNIRHVTVENRPLARKYFEKHVSRRLDAGRTDPRALALGLYLEHYPLPTLGLSDNRELREASNEFWSTGSHEFELTLHNALDSHRRKFRWAAAECVRRGRMGIREALDTFGPFLLFDPSIAGDIVVPPIAYSVIREREKGSWVNKLLVDEIINVLVEAPTPWIRHSEEVVFIRPYMRRPIASQPRQNRDVALVLALPFLELDLSIRKANRNDPSENDRRIVAEQLMRTVHTSDRKGLRTKKASPPTFKNDSVASLYETWVQHGLSTYEP